MVDVPTCPGAGVTVTRRWAPLPVMEMPLMGITDGLLDDAENWSPFGFASITVKFAETGVFTDVRSAGIPLISGASVGEMNVILNVARDARLFWFNAEMIIVTIPRCPGSGVISSTRTEPEPLKTMLFSGTIAGLDVAVKICSVLRFISATVKPTRTGLPGVVLRSSGAVITGMSVSGAVTFISTSREDVSPN